MSEVIGLFMVWLGGALCGVVYTTLWFAYKLRRIDYAADTQEPRQ